MAFLFPDQGITKGLINFRSPEWFDQYLAFRKDHPLSLDLPDPEKLGFSEEQLNNIPSLRHPLYTMLLHSGLIYGFPFLYPFRPHPPGKMGTRWTTKLVLVDMILHSVLSDLTARDGAGADYAAHLKEAAALIRTYYRGIMTAHSGVDDRSIEHLLADRVTFHRNWLDWRRTGINTHLFWDWYFFRKYLRMAIEGKAPESVDFQALLEEKKAMKWLTMELIAAAAHCDARLKRREKVLEHHFEKSSHFFSPKEKDRLHRVFREGLTLDQLHFPKSADWTVRRYWLDISLLVLYSDKEIQAPEEAFLETLCQKLALSDDELLESKLALGGFLLRFGRKIPFISSRKSSMALIAQALGQNFAKMKKATHAEYKETLEMADTLGRLMQHQLGIAKGKDLPSEEEIAAAFDQIKDLPKFLPFFTMVFLPVPGVTEMYILLAYSIERLSGESIRLLPSNFSKMVKGK